MYLNIINSPLVLSNYSANTVVCMRCKRKSVICTCYYLCFCAYSSSVELLLGLQQSVWCVFPPFSLIQNRTNDFCANIANLTQSIASANANVSVWEKAPSFSIPFPCFSTEPILVVLCANIQNFMIRAKIYREIWSKKSQEGKASWLSIIIYNKVYLRRTNSGCPRCLPWWQARSWSCLHTA